MVDRYLKSHIFAENASLYDAWISSELSNPLRRNYQSIDGHYPVFGARADGAQVWDVDGNCYIDYQMGYGSVLLGHRRPEVIDAVCREIQAGHCLSPLWKPIQAELCQLICSVVPNAERAFLMKTGSDASSGAVRLARLFTGRDRVLRWGYNGWHDWCTPRPGGVPLGSRDVVHEFPYNDLAAVTHLFERYGEEIACVFMMPFELDKPAPGFLENVRALAHSYGAIFILDEMRSGFRFAVGGAQEYLGINADLVTFSKAMANGFAISCVAGRADILAGVTDTKMTATYFSTTEAMAASLCTIKLLCETDAIDRIWSLGERFLSGLRDVAEKENGIVSVLGFPPCPFLEFNTMSDAENGRAKHIFFARTAAEGILFHPSHHWYISASHTEQNIDDTISVCAAALREVGERL